MKVAIVYNEIIPDVKIQEPVEAPKDLGFQPYFEISESDPITEFEFIAESLRKEGYDAYVLNILDDVHVFLEDLDKNNPDVIFNFVEIYRDKPHLEMAFAGMFELLRIPYTGANPVALGTCQNKLLTKKILKSLGIRTPKYKLVKDKKQTYRLGLNYPLIVKPVREDASVGIENDSIVTNHEDLKNRIHYSISYFNQPALVEEFIEGRELNVAVLGDKYPEVLPISEIDFSRMPDNLHNIVSYHAKWDPMHEAYHKTIPVCPAELPERIEKEAGRIAIESFKAVGARDYARVDMRLSKDNKLYVLEVNPNPDLKEDAGFMRSMSHAGYSFRKTLKTIVDLAWERREK
ncbi:MAG: ATP-grasp domain-containing protein [bacterium]